MIQKENFDEGKGGAERSERTMNTYRLTNTTHTEVAPSLPLPSLPIFFGATAKELSLFEDSGSATGLQARDSSNIIAQARKIAELLRATDISYLSLREESKDGSAAVSAEPGSLLAAVLENDPEAFNYSIAGPLKQWGCRNSAVDKRFTSQASAQQVGLASAQNQGGNMPQNIHKTPIPHSSEDLQSPTSARKTRIKRKENQGGTDHMVSPQSYPDSNHDAVVGSLCEVLDEMLERTDAPGEEEGEEGGSFLCLADIKTIADVIGTAHAKNALQLVPVAHLVRLLNMLDRHVRHAHDLAVDDDDDDDIESENYSIVICALESVQTALTIMTHPDMPKQVYKEEIIERVIEFTRYQIVHSIFTAYDPLYRQIHKSAEVDDDIADEDLDMENGATPGKRGRRKTKFVKARRASSSKVSGSVSSVLHKLCSILALLKDLLFVERLLDSTVLQLIKTVLATFGVDNIQLLQLKAIGVACSVFTLYSQHRTIIMDEILSLLWKLPSSKRNLRSYHLPDEEPKQIQILTALLLQLVQCSVMLPEEGQKTLSTGAESCVSDVSSNAIKCFEPAMEASTYFWRNVLQRWTLPKAQEGADIRGLVENLMVDLLTTLNAPEFPASSLLLQVLCVLLFGSAGLKSRDAAVRATAIDLLGQIAARLKQDAVASSKDTLWILQEAQSENSEAGPPSKENCVSCKGGRGAKYMVPCDGCHHWFHGDCVGMTSHDMIGRGWLCHCCLCKRQLASLESFLRAQAKEGKLNFVIKKDSTEATAPTDFTVPKTGVAVLQQILLNYLQEATNNDNTAAYARRFYFCQWYRDDPLGEQNLLFYHARWTSKAPLSDFGVAPNPLSRDVIVRIAAALGQQRPLARGFDRILERLLVGLQENSPTPRAKALRAVSAIVEVDPGVLGDERVQRAVEGRFLDSAISVREAAMELVGRHIASRPDVAVKYFDKIAERIMDTGVSVRKRVIKIIRDICVSRCEFAKATDACVRIISRINDEETSIQDLVCKTFYELWFEEPSNQPVHFVGDGSTVPFEISERAQQLVDVLKCLPSHQPLVTIIKRSLALDFCPQTLKNSATSLVSQASVRNRCELMCKCLMESILKAEETNSEEAETRALPYVLALHAFCIVDPTLCAPPSDPSRFAVTLQPYLKTQVDNRDVAQLLQSIVFVIDTVLPLLRRPPQSFVEELERDLRQLIVRYSFLTVVHACIKCLCSLGNITAKGVTSFEFLIRRFFKLLDCWCKGHYGAAEKPNVLRCLFCLGLLVRYGADIIDTMNEKEITMDQLLSLYKHYLRSEDFDVKARSLQALGFVFVARPEFMMEKDMGKMLEATLSSAADIRIKIQTLRNFYDYLLDVEEKMGLDEAGTDTASKSKKDSGGAVPVAAGAGDSNICGGIIQLHWEHILERCLDMNDQVRQAALKVVEIVLRQGLVHPMTCVPHLIALEVDQQESNSKLAHRLLMHMNEKYPSFFESRLGDGLQLSFRFIESGAASSSQALNSSKLSSVSRSKSSGSMAVSAKSGISRTYKLIRGSRVSRNKFLSSVVRKFDTGTWGPSSIHFLVYCTEVLASLPFSLPDEPLYLVYAINRIVQVQAGAIEANIKSLILEGPLGIVANQVSEALAVERQRDSENAYNLDAMDSQKIEDQCEVDDTQGIPEEALLQLKADCHAAVAIALLLRLKRHLKIVYNLNDARCQAFSPTEQIKSGEVLSKQSVKDFSIKEIPVHTAQTVRQMLKQYQAFKRLLKEDSMDYSSYTANIPKKRGRPPGVTSGGQQTEDGYDMETQANGHFAALRPLRRKSMQGVTKAGSSDEDDDEDLDNAHEDAGDDEYGSRGRKRKRGSSGGRGRRKKQSL